MSLRHLALPALAATLLAGCSSPPLQVHDTGATLALARAALRPGGAAGGPGVELELARVRGQERQTLSEFDQMRLGGSTIDGPATLLNEARSESAQLVYHHRLFAGRPLEMAWFAGVATGRLDWTSTVEGSGLRVRSRSRWTGPTGGASVRWNMHPRLFGEARYGGTAAISGSDTGTRAMLELALGWQPAPALQLRVGIAETQISLLPSGGWTELEFRSRGPFAALVIGY